VSVVAFALGAAILLFAVVDDATFRRVGALVARVDPRTRAALRDRRHALPGLVDAVAAALGSGLSVQQAFTEIARSLPRSLAVATERASASLALGRPLEDSLSAYDDVVPAEDLAPFAVVLTAFARSGGKIGRSLARVATLLRGRLALEEERAALTAQGRASAIVLIALAPLGALFFAVMTPEYMAVMIDRGRWLSAIAVGLEIAGALWLLRILRITAPDADFASLLDAVIVGLDAGLTFELALASLLARSTFGTRVPASRRLLADLALARGRSTAFNAFGASGPTEARVAALVSAATRFGSPLAEMLVTQADVLRSSERRRAEAQARRLPILMLFPLAFCVLPALLVVFLGPPLLSLLR
jgi:Flp pilus assembly protein TadB